MPSSIYYSFLLFLNNQPLFRIKNLSIAMKYGMDKRRVRDAGPAADLF